VTILKVMIEFKQVWLNVLVCLFIDLCFSFIVCVMVIYANLFMLLFLVTDPHVIHERSFVNVRRLMPVLIWFKNFLIFFSFGLNRLSL